MLQQGLGVLPAAPQHPHLLPCRRTSHLALNDVQEHLQVHVQGSQSPLRFTLRMVATWQTRPARPVGLAVICRTIAQLGVHRKGRDGVDATHPRW